MKIDRDSFQETARWLCENHMMCMSGFAGSECVEDQGELTYNSAYLLKSNVLKLVIICEPCNKAASIYDLERL